MRLGREPNDKQSAISLDINRNILLIQISQAKQFSVSFS